MESFEGYVSGLDAQATPHIPLRTQAFMQNRDSNVEIQVTTYHHRLQTALELAAQLDKPVEVSYEDMGGEFILQRVRVLDRD